MAASRIRKRPETGLDVVVDDVLTAAGVGGGDVLCVALSGGIDSVVLLDVLHGLRSHRRLRLVAAHVHHGLSPNADSWRDFCAGLCARLDVPLRCLMVQVDRAHPQGIEAAAREARYAALRSVGADWLMLGHHQDDQAETVLFRLLRGTGVRGAAGMRVLGDGPGEGGARVMRPLLGVRRDRIRAHAEARALAWVDDESNADTRFSRNRIRCELLPVLENAFPAGVPMLARAADHFREAEGLLQALARIDSGRCAVSPATECAVWHSTALATLDDARLCNLLRDAMRAMGAEVSARTRLTEALRQWRAGSGRPLRVSLGSVSLCEYRGRTWLEQNVCETSAPVRWRGEEVLRWGGTAVRFAIHKGEGLACARLDGAVVELSARWPGLVMRVRPGGPHRTFKNLCQEAGVPAWMRSGLPVLRVEGEAVWVGGIGTSAEYQCAPGDEGIVVSWPA